MLLLSRVDLFRSANQLQIALDEITNDIALIEPDLQDWGWCASYLFEQFEKEARRRGKRREFDEMIKPLRDYSNLEY